MAVEPGSVNEPKLRELLAEQHEADDVEYKDVWDLDQRKHVLELALAVGAMQSRAGHIVVGVDGSGRPTGNLTDRHVELLDPAVIDDKIGRYLPPSIELRVGRHRIDGANVVLIYVARRAEGLTAFLRDGTYATREVGFPIAGGIPLGSWIALHKGQELLDRRGLDPTWGQTDVEIEVDPVTEVEVLISRGEGVSTEFKRQLPTDERENVVNVMKTIAAFANGGGGTLLFGVDNDGTVLGLDVNDARETLDRTTQLIRDWVRPHVDFDTEVTEVDGKQVLLVRVDAGAEPPYGVGTTERRIDYYVRRSATTSPATPTDVRAFVRARLSADASPRPFFR